MIFRKSYIFPRILTAAIINFLVFSNSFILDEFIRLWEVEEFYKKTLNIETKYTAIVLGGNIAVFDSKKNNVIFKESADRLIQAEILYHENFIENIIISAGNPAYSKNEPKEAEILKKYLLSVYIPDTSIIIESLSENTYQNALECSKIIKKRKISNIVLFTSAIHMRRARVCFLNQDIEIIPFSTNKMAGNRKYDVKHLLIPDIQCFVKWKMLLHEVFGYCTYKLLGYF